MQEPDQNQVEVPENKEEIESSLIEKPLDEGINNVQFAIDELQQLLDQLRKMKQ